MIEKMMLMMGIKYLVDYIWVLDIMFVDVIKFNMYNVFIINYKFDIFVNGKVDWGIRLGKDNLCGFM